MLTETYESECMECLDGLEGCTWCGGTRTVTLVRRAIEDETTIGYNRPEKAITHPKEPKQMSNVKMVRSDEKRGKKFEQVAVMLKELKDAKGEPVAFDTLCAAAGAKYPQDVQAAMFALELAEVVDRYTYAEPGSSRQQVAYAVRPEVLAADPS